MTGSEDIRVVEQGKLDLSADDPRWKAISGERSFWRLVDQGVVKVRQLAADTVQIEGTQYVGRAQIGEVLIRADPKIPGADRALLSYAAGDSFRLVSAATPATELGPLLVLLIRELIKKIKTYVARGREFRYERELATGSLAGGKIDFAATSRLRARGFTHLYAFRRNKLSHRTLKNRLIRAALMDIQPLARAVDVPPDVLAEARGLALLFEDCLDAEVLFASRRRLLAQAEALRVQSSSEAERDLLALVSVVFSRVSFEIVGASDATVPRSWFLDLSTLFETALRRVLDEFGRRKGVRVEKGTSTFPAIFDGISDRYRAAPDFVFRSADGRVAVADAKYKEWDETASSSDLYQLLVHASAFRATSAALVFPHSSFAEIDLGRSTTRVSTRLTAVDVTRLEDAGPHLLDLLPGLSGDDEGPRESAAEADATIVA